MSHYPRTFFWMGTPADDLSREELYEIILDLIDRDRRNNQQSMERSIAHIRDLASMAQGKAKTMSKEMGY